MVRQAWGRLERVEPALVGLLLLGCFVARIPTVTFHPDESQWIYSSLAFEKFVKLQWSSPMWHESYWTLTQPPLTRYVIGAGRRLGGYANVNTPWRFYLSAEENVERGAMPSAGLLWWSRLPMAVLASLSCWAWYLWLRRAFGRAAGWVWATQCLISGYVSVTLGRAMGEAPLVAMVTAAAWAGQGVLSSQSQRRSLLWLLVFGLLAGSAGAAKLNGLVLAASGVALAAAAARRQQGSVQARTTRLAAATLLVAVATVAAFVAWNPFLYRDPVGRGLKMLDHREAEMQQQTIDYPDALLPEGLSRCMRIAWDLLQRDAPLSATPLFALNLALAVAGLVRLCKRSWRWLDGLLIDPLAPVTLAVLGLASIPALFTRLDWQRYYVLPEWLVMVLLAVGCEWLLQHVPQLWRGRRTLI